MVGGELRERQIDQTERLLGLEALRVVFFRDKDGKEHRVDAALFRAREIKLAVGNPVADIAAVIQLAIDHMHVTIEYESVTVEFSGALGNLRLRNNRASQEECCINASHECARDSPPEPARG